VAQVNTQLKGWAKAGPNWDEGKPKHGGSVAFRDHAPDIEFVKMRTDATGSTPSQIVYSVRVRPQLRAATAPPDFIPQHAPPSRRRRKKKLDQLPKMSEMDLKLQKLRLEREEKRRAEEEHSRYQDQVIKQWLAEKAETENGRIRHEQTLKLREKKKMEKDRQRIERIEADLAMNESEGSHHEEAPLEPIAHKSSQLSTSQYLQRQRQLLLEDYLRKHMSLPLQARSPVLAGLEQLQPPRPPRASSANSKTREELLSQLTDMESQAQVSLTMDSKSPLPAISNEAGLEQG